jgi:membrane-associated phospholipid phosphatase
MIRAAYSLGWNFLMAWPYILQFMYAGVTAFAISWLFGWLYPHRRPIVEFPEIKEIVKPLSNWKSLPSDHTIAAFLLVYFLWYYRVPFGINSGWFVCYFLWATIVSVARVFAGVHYPRDIVAGFLLASGIAYLFFK